MKDSDIVETNEYRVLKMCSNCPFRDNGEAVHLDDGRVDDIKKMLLENDHNSFTCHKTAYNLDKDMNPVEGFVQPKKMCAGAYEYLKKMGRPNIMMRIAMASGIENE